MRSLKDVIITRSPDPGALPASARVNGQLSRRLQPGGLCMNYGEEIAYWYLRLNGFFPITNFVIHRSERIPHTSDCDVLAVRMPDVYEEIGGKPEDWDQDFAMELGFDRVLGVICEVKTGGY